MTTTLLDGSVLATEFVPKMSAGGAAASAMMTTTTGGSSSGNTQVLTFDTPTNKADSDAVVVSVPLVVQHLAARFGVDMNKSYGQQVADAHFVQTNKDTTVMERGGRSFKWYSPKPTSQFPRGHFRITTWSASMLVSPKEAEQRGAFVTGTAADGLVQACVRNGDERYFTIMDDGAARCYMQRTWKMGTLVGHEMHWDRQTGSQIVRVIEHGRHRNIVSGRMEATRVDKKMQYMRSGQLAATITSQYMGNKRHGRFDMIMASGKVVVRGAFRNGKKHTGSSGAPWLVLRKDGTVRFAGRYVNGRKDGEHVRIGFNVCPKTGATTSVCVQMHMYDAGVLVDATQQCMTVQEFQVRQWWWQAYMP